jgi:hypothetical protein
MRPWIAALLLSLAFNYRGTYDDISDRRLCARYPEIVLTRESEHIGRIIPATVLSIERARLFLADDSHTDLTATAPRKYGAHPGAKIIFRRNISVTRHILNDN